VLQRPFTPRAMAWFQAPRMLQVAGAGSTGETLVTSSGGPQGKMEAVRSTPAWHNQDLAEATNRPGTSAPVLGQIRLPHSRVPYPRKCGAARGNS
jgi:hypothetical protein